MDCEFLSVIPHKRIIPQILVEELTLQKYKNF